MSLQNRPRGAQDGLFPMFCSVQYHFRMKFGYRRAPCGFKEAREERMHKAGETSDDHAHAKIRSLKQVL